MRLASCVQAGAAFAAVIEGERAVALAGVDELGPATLPAAGGSVRGEAFALGDVQLRPVIPSPRKVICVGLNFRPHVSETARELPSYPVLFTKFALSLCGPYAAIALPRESSQVDWEGEVAVVIGKPGRRIPRADALEHVAGYTLANDVSMRDYQRKSPQWLQGKCWEATTPLGPWLVTADEVPDPSALVLRTTLNGETVQEASLSTLIFDIPTLISTISEAVTLEPGDVILTGTPGGVGMARTPPRYLAPGDVVGVEAEGLGRLENVFV
ncbi:fumarylacetoacetate hydrolase family protein [Solirubrobacter ginsenosidimutans]|uniref:Fumarylacetoacetate hydrolase family protein n=1 Tax=Solirubrobacter ginsenosidimutans TaxID=490573 RepID=A0A9X3MP71_9ACTN|nr:fumarylacetoacetate hydrolase family protein [Solirubrobacter ginsenosidimutans]MDA0159251.1 fumarylacetoacetate hydrolase family protein [Solirubrobacter ginsenosidimutans]